MHKVLLYVCIVHACLITLCAIHATTDTRDLNDHFSEEFRSAQSSAKHSDWQQLMQRKEESWEIIRQQMFEYLLANEAISDINVSLFSVLIVLMEFGCYCKQCRLRATS